MRHFFLAVSAAAFFVFVPAHAQAVHCGVPVSDGTQPTATDALYILRASVGSVLCTLSACDTTSDCLVTATDALRSLRVAVGYTLSLSCKASCMTATPCTESAAAVCNGICFPGFACTADNADLTAPDQRVTICHIGESGPETRTVDPNRLEDHLLHGDKLGPCTQPDGAALLDGAWSTVAEPTAATDDTDASTSPAPAAALPELGVGTCSCRPLTVTLPSTTTTVAEGSTTTTTTSTSTTNTLPPPPEGDPDNDGLFDTDDPCPLDVRNRCFGPLAVDTLTGVPLRINADSSGAHECAGIRTDCAGDTWFPDFGYTSPFTGHECDVEAETCTIHNLEPLFGCSSPATADILQCEHFDRPPLPELGYSFNVPNGTYVVNMFFANTYKTTRIPGKRVFDISIEGRLVYPAFDQVAQAGGSRIALLRAAVVTVADGNGLQIDFGHVVENPTIKAIEVFAGP
jgi:hypothetical protein